MNFLVTKSIGSKFYVSTFSLPDLFAEDSLIINSVVRTRCSKSFTGLLLSISCISKLVATYPISNAGCFMIDNDGFNNSATSELEKRISSISPGILSPMAFRILKHHVVSLSAEAKIAFGFSFSLNISFTAFSTRGANN